LQDFHFALNLLSVCRPIGFAVTSKPLLG
jgi:hypothetical protein